MSKCTGITLIETSPTHGDLLRVTIDNTASALWFYDYAESLKYLDQEVIVEYRNDIYQGNMTQFIKTFTIPTVVHTLDKQDNIKLYLETEDNNSNLSFTEIEPGDTRPGAIVFCVASEFKSSARAVWQEFIIRDKMMRTATLRLFDYDNNQSNLAGQYVMVDLTRNKYGFQTDMVAPVSGQVAENPELTVAEQFVRNYFSTDAVALDYINQQNMFQQLREHIDYEKGYSIVRMASELALVDSMKNITKDVDLVAIGHAILCSYGHCVRKSVLSDSVNNVTLMLNYAFPDKRIVGQILDVALEEKPKEYVVYKSIKDTVAALLEMRKGCNFES